MKLVHTLFVILVMTTAIFSQQKIVLFDNTHAEQAGNADWVIDQDNKVAGRYPTPDQATITAATTETFWTGALSSWGIGLVKMGYKVETLPTSGAITYGNSSNAQDLSKYDVFVVDEPNGPFNATEKTAILNFVKNGGGLFMISDHGIADRDGDGWDAVRVWNDLFRNNTHTPYPFGMVLDSTNIVEITTKISTTAAVDSILTGSSGACQKLQISNGSTFTLKPDKNPSVKGLVWRNSATVGGNTGVFAASATYGKGKVILIGDSSPADDGTGATGDNLYPGWTEQGTNHSAFHLNGTVWLATKTPMDVKSEDVEVEKFELLNNYPNPFNPSTEIRFNLTEQNYTSVKVYDAKGKEVTTLVAEVLSAGKHSVRFNAKDLSSGVYFYQLVSGNNIKTGKMVFMK